MKKTYKNDNTDKLFKVISKLNTPDDCEAFFEDLCTIKEIQDMAQRLFAAKLLDDGESYQNISSETGISSATISRVNQCINYGSGGYQKALEILKSESDK